MSTFDPKRTLRILRNRPRLCAISHLAARSQSARLYLGGPCGDGSAPWWRGGDVATRGPCAATRARAADWCASERNRGRCGISGLGRGVPAGAVTTAAEQVAKILDGARPSELPLRQATRFELVINNKTAKGLGLTIPASLLERVD